MRFILIALGLGFVASNGAAFAPHPSILTVKYKDHMWPVVEYGVGGCVAIIDGQRKELWRPDGFALQPAPGYSDNFVESPGQLGGPVKIEKLGGPHQTQAPDHLVLTTTLIARKELYLGFTVVGIYSAAHLSDPPSAANSPALIIEGLPRLPAGQPVEVEINLGVLNPPKDPSYFVLIFDSSGREVITSGVEYAWEYFSLCDRARMKVAQKMYLEKFPGADHNAVPAITPKPVLPAEKMPLPEGLSTVLTITEEGVVSGVEIQGTEDPAIRKALTTALEGWLFLPKLKAGQPVPVKIAIPLKF